jgi:hypothetical protein
MNASGFWVGRSWPILWMGVALLLGAVAQSQWAYWRAGAVIEPYTDVRVLRQERIADKLHLTASFRKAEQCVLVRYAIFGIVGPYSLPLEYIDNDALPREFDRAPGTHTLRNIIILGAADPDMDAMLSTSGWDRVEIRTRHVCIGRDDHPRTLQRLFAVIDPDAQILPPEPIPGEWRGVPAVREVVQ